MKIIDVSSNNGVIDWQKVAGSGVSDAIIRLSMGYNSKDKRADSNATGAAAAGIDVSYYHFAYPDKRPGTVIEDAIQEAGYFVGLFSDGKLPAPRWLVVDLENWEKEKDSPLKPVEYLAWIKKFTAEVRRLTGITCIIYSYQWYLDSHLPADHGLGNRPLWIANYNKTDAPKLPTGWEYYFMWQYSAEGTVPGVSTNCDLNVMYRGQK